jgi:hypothetical protein
MDERASQAIEYHKALDRLRSENIDELSRTKELGTSLDFSSALPQLREMADYFECFSNNDLNRLPIQSLHTLTNCCNQLLLLIGSIKAFGPGESNALNARMGILNSVDQTHHSLVQTLSPLISMLRYKQTENLSGIGSAEISEKFASLDNNIDKSSEQLKEIDEILARARKFAAESVVDQQASVFLDQSTNHQDIAKRWLITLFALLAVTLIAAVISYSYTPAAILNASGTGAVVYLIASKSVIFGLLIFSILVSARNYSAHRHNEVINKHRHNALLTYNTFVSAGSSAEMRDIVLNHASTAIYGPADTGYNKHPEAPSNMFPVVNVPIPK